MRRSWAIAALALASCGTEAYYGPWTLAVPDPAGAPENVRVVQLPGVPLGMRQRLRVDATVKGVPGDSGAVRFDVSERAAGPVLATRFVAIAPGETQQLVLGEEELAAAAADPRRGPSAGLSFAALRFAASPSADGVAATVTFTVRVAEVKP